MTTSYDPEAIAAATLDATRHNLFIGGIWQPAANGASFAVNNPATNMPIAMVPDGGATETTAAVEAAAQALPEWAATPAPARAAVLRRAAALMLERQETLATIMTLEQGKPLSEARGEIAYAASFLTWFAGEAERIYGMTIPATQAHKRLLVLRQPVGICALITPWNFPSAMITRKLGPALAAGCTVVVKPAEQTPLSALELAHIFQAAGLPPGCFNLITCQNPDAFADVIFNDERVRKVSFTGSTEVGKLLIRASATTIKRLSLELGGNAPFIVFADADLDAAVQGAIASKFRNTGQTCVCANRIFVAQAIYAAFAERFSAAVAALPVGNGLAPTTAIGPLIDAQARAKVERHISDALEHGAELLTGGGPAHEAGAGHFWQPTVLSAAHGAMLIAREETFGPVAPLIPFYDEASVLHQANATPYGLAAYVYTRDLARVWRVAEGLEYGIIGINDPIPSTAQAPFGGLKQSGFGREGGPSGIHEYLEEKYVSLGLE
ncbi:NAD-dependent succinate-semialdehyde dehydrogenase [Candidatus Viridilinea mediisalina]|uniref:Succinate-semialdehyde dehydrogenase (NADP(+)) n=1 Tax=Candidatus Viridilinea mediisalina TaxID=2024553 RepID=A0A2A6RNS4_9CHLR|nr:NAD-dependent succinate-semialdehyde dehydrogenase [Candidatus Viridilinea mediisalina]PDW04593.1 succinate-semialdehyde dehydrogenase (NADP(+)) [Candidatus Viridilinea mediisalina]